MPAISPTPIKAPLNHLPETNDHSRSNVHSRGPLVLPLPSCKIYFRCPYSTGLQLSRAHKRLHIRNLTRLSLIGTPLTATLSPAWRLLPLTDSKPPDLVSSDLPHPQQAGRTSLPGKLPAQRGPHRASPDLMTSAMANEYKPQRAKWL